MLHQSWSLILRLHKSFKPIQRKTFLVSGMLGSRPNLTALKAVCNIWSLRTWRHVTHAAAFLPSVGDCTQVTQQNSTMEVLGDSSPPPPSLHAPRTVTQLVQGLSPLAPPHDRDNGRTNSRSSRVCASAAGAASAFNDRDCHWQTIVGTSGLQSPEARPVISTSRHRLIALSAACRRPVAH